MVKYIFAIVAPLCFQLMLPIADLTTGTPLEVGPWLQAGSFGLVVYAIVWMYPREADKARAERAARDASALKERQETLLAFSAMVEHQQKRFEDRNALLVGAISSQTTTLNQGYENSATRIERAVVNVCRGMPGVPRSNPPLLGDVK